MWTYRCKLKRVIDGDTDDVDIDLGFGIWQMNERARIMGIDTPESRTRDKIETKFGLAAKAKLKSILGKDTVLKTTINKKHDTATSISVRRNSNCLKKNKSITPKKSAIKSIIS